jgi:DNA-binding response OmpR family regulator
MSRLNLSAGKRILIVEDDDQLRLALRRFFERRELEVLLATDGLSALKELIDNDVDAIVTDYKMAVLGGSYWVRFLAKFCAHIPVIVTSGFLRPEITIPFPVLLKPYTFEELEASIRSAFE